MDHQQVIKAWEAFQATSGGIGLPRNEDEYEQSYSLLEHLSEHHDAKREPYASLLHLASSYAAWWVQTRALAHKRGSWHLTREEAADLLNVSAKYVDKLVAHGDLTLTQTPDGPRLDLITVRAYHHARHYSQQVALWRIIRIGEEAEAYAAERLKREP